MKSALGFTVVSLGLLAGCPAAAQALDDVASLCGGRPGCAVVKSTSAGKTAQGRPIPWWLRAER